MQGTVSGGHSSRQVYLKSERRGSINFLWETSSYVSGPITQKRRLKRGWGRRASLWFVCGLGILFPPVDRRPVQGWVGCWLRQFTNEGSLPFRCCHGRNCAPSGLSWPPYPPDESLTTQSRRIRHDINLTRYHSELVSISRASSRLL